MQPSALRPLLRCPVCRTTLLAPITLFCGHTVCSSHLRPSEPCIHPSSDASSDSPLMPGALPTSSSPPPEQPRPASGRSSCPLPACRYTAGHHTPPNIPSTSQVRYYPAAVPASEQGMHEFSVISDSRTDVTVNKILDLVLQEDTDFPDNHFVPTLDDSDDNTDDEYHDSELPISRGPSAPRTLSPDFSISVGMSRPRSPTDMDSSPSHRPRKRRRRQVSSHPPHRRDTPHLPPPDADARFEKALAAELNCEICFMLMHQPVTTPCQHTFCSKCLQRSLDHSTQCPLCRQALPAFAYLHDHPHNKVVLSIILKAFPDAYAERQLLLEQEERDARLDTPIFVCNLAFPGMPTFLHLFEPRYRLMLRRCLESPNACFGMIMPPRPTGQGTGNDYGTMLKITSVHMLPDGRSMVETLGTHRFRIMERGTLDGYMVGRIERIDDFPEELDDAEERIAAELQTPGLTSVPDLPTLSPASTSAGAGVGQPSNEGLMDICRSFLDQLQEGAAPWVVQRLNTAAGPMPTDPASFSFWMAVILPIDEIEKAKLLPIKSPRLRLRLVVYWIEQLNSNWWFSGGCTIS